ARHGSIRSPIWRNGGIVFGPHPRSYRRLLPKKMRRAALKSALSLRAQGGQVWVLESWQAEKPKTKEFKALLEKLPLEGKTVLVVTADYQPNVYRAGRNLPGVTVMEARELSPYQVLRHRHLILEKDAVGRLEEVFA
ncbi:MAG: 50S ribosomal protein L4, partial [Bacillota bacterium]|nr:50S ribosomal protein L4 [Bacillota bacterium]